MLLEGKFVASIVEIVAKSLVDIFGKRANAFFDRDEVRAASYESYYALRRMEDILADIEQDIIGFQHTHSRREYVHDADGSLGKNLRRLQAQLDSLKESFSTMRVKMEIFHSMDEAAAVRIALGADDDLIRALFKYEYEFDKMDLKSLWRDMHTSVVAARETIAKFIKTNYKVDQKESGR